MQQNEFLAIAEHEIRTPLNGIVGFARLLTKAPLSDGEKKYADTILACAESMVHILDDILDLSCLEAGGFKIETCPFAVRSLVQEVHRLFSLQAKQKSLVFEAAVSSDMPERLVGDVGRLRQVLTNLTSNAIRFTDCGRVAIEVCCEPVISQIFFGVKDTGVGIPADMLQTIFNPFARYQKRGEKGLSLAISKRLVESMGGSLCVESKLGLGSHFFFRLPLASDLAE